MRNTQKSFLNKQEYAHQHQLRQRIGGIYLCQGLIPGLPHLLLLPEYEPAVQQIGDQHRDQKGNQIAYLFVEAKTVVAGIGDYIRQNCINCSYNAEFKKLRQGWRKLPVQSACYICERSYFSHLVLPLQERLSAIYFMLADVSGSEYIHCFVSCCPASWLHPAVCRLRIQFTISRF